MRYDGVLCQVNCFFTGYNGKQATLIPVGEAGEKRRMYFPDVTEKVEYLGPVVQENGRIWVSRKRHENPFGVLDE